MYYIRFKKDNNQILYVGEKKPLNKENGVCEVAEVEYLPVKTNAQHYEIFNVREETKVIKEAYSEEEIYWNEETEQEETRIVEFPAITKTYLTCDILIKDRPQISEEVKAQMIAKQQLERYEKRVEQLIRQKYTLSQELAILRQRDTKPTEFAIYNDYAEQCKLQAKTEIYGV